MEILSILLPIAEGMGVCMLTTPGPQYNEDKPLLIPQQPANAATCDAHAPACSCGAGWAAPSDADDEVPFFFGFHGGSKPLARISCRRTRARTARHESDAHEASQMGTACRVLIAGMWGVEQPLAKKHEHVLMSPLTAALTATTNASP